MACLLSGGAGHRSSLPPPIHYIQTRQPLHFEAHQTLVELQNTRRDYIIRSQFDLQFIDLQMKNWRTGPPVFLIAEREGRNSMICPGKWVANLRRTSLQEDVIHVQSRVAAPAIVGGAKQDADRLTAEGQQVILTI